MEDRGYAPYTDGEDRISELPDHLIHEIFSSIDTKWEVRTCVLSKRWINIWKSLHVLNFSRRSFLEDKRDCFVMLVDMVLIFRCQDFNIQRMWVNWRSTGYDRSVIMNVNRWCLAAVKYNVQNLIIEIGQCDNWAYEIPHRLLNCKSLTELAIEVDNSPGYVDVIFPRLIDLPQLKKLSFIGLSVSDVESSKILFSGCPSLEKLRIIDCDIHTDKERKLIVDSVSLKKFECTCWCKHLLAQNDIVANSIKLCAPNLEELICISVMKQEHSLEICSPLPAVQFNIRFTGKTRDENSETYEKLPLKEKEVYAKQMIKFLEAAYMVKKMRLSPGFLEVLFRAPDLLDCQPPCLCNLQGLVLDMWFTRGCLRAIAYLFTISPKITELTLASMETNLGDVGDDWETGLSVPGMLSHLELIRIKEVEGNYNELKLLSFLLRNAKALRKVVLYPRSTIDRVRDQFLVKLKALPRASSHIILQWPATKSTCFI
ncbi:hypothetical protein C5167_004071 [Papaver somniferum]|uniref:F-box/FBD/LRR-repeat protein At1g78750-like n=1 Tax=Papaver somniferum TaxID=3469 RepID=UPI000E6FE624|nr:F-box/FBD/LRR-repeat protein At1g78750-like [Papaver somniferum]RZC87892.1 hypothetical protein C5167_004071 [Papaver somniferum]